MMEDRNKKHTVLKMDTNSCKPLREVVFETIRSAIVHGTLKPGERLMEVKLANELGVSRTPVRESIRKLELEGLVEMVPRKGAYVTPMSITDLREMMEIRGALEALVAELAAQRASAEDIDKMKRSNRKFEDSVEKNDGPGIIDNDILFHEAFYQSSGNGRLENMIHTLREQMLRFRVEYVRRIALKKPLPGQHRQIIDAIERHDSEGASQAALRHIKLTEDDMLVLLADDEAFENK
jgi:DNA-binding GntR family transcriptional regulator